EGNAAASCDMKPRDASSNRCLPASRFADESDALTWLDGEGDVIHRGPLRPARAVVDLEPGNLEERGPRLANGPRPEILRSALGRQELLPADAANCVIRGRMVERWNRFSTTRFLVGATRREGATARPLANADRD